MPRLGTKTVFTTGTSRNGPSREPNPGIDIGRNFIGTLHDRWMRYAGTITINAAYLSMPNNASIEQRIEGQRVVWQGGHRQRHAGWYGHIRGQGHSQHPQEGLPQSL